ncbi:unnamed protein product [Protopolystoma xenopodis]|uniref:Uncharacterized protein n=1 Tax=Protopolystoma xenopodis TaxID=117903 RepID=A0A3S5BPS3_9PLAT|nr:unnamed protein product [Protopolystoma xenopodis]
MRSSNVPRRSNTTCRKANFKSALGYRSVLSIGVATLATTSANYLDCLVPIQTSPAILTCVPSS